MNRKDYGATLYDRQDTRTTRSLNRESGRTWAYLCSVCGVAAALSGFGSDSISMWILASAFFAAALIFGVLNSR